jgi:hypothetical protein
MREHLPIPAENGNIHLSHYPIGDRKIGKKEQLYNQISRQMDVGMRAHHVVSNADMEQMQILSDAMVGIQGL